MYVQCIPVPLVKTGGHNSNNSLPGHGGGTILLQQYLPVVTAMREHRVGTHTHPRGVLTNADRVATVGDVCLRVT